MSLFYSKYFKFSAIALAAMASLSPANAGWMDTMYTEMAANASVNAAGVYQTQSMNIFSGGGLVWKIPQRNFQPFTFTPPSIKQGCGGIDLFMGSFGFINKDEFVQMLNYIGQNAAGLLFQTALQAMSPELSAQLEAFSKKMQEMTQFSKNSCEMAKSLNKTLGLDTLAHEMGTLARRAGIAAVSPLFDNEVDARDKIDKSGAQMEAGAAAATTTNSGGYQSAGKDLNITWSAISSGNFASLSNADKEVIQGILGTVIITWVGSGVNRVPTIIPKRASGVAIIDDWVGDYNVTSTSLPVLTCSETVVCLSVTETVRNETPLAKRVYEALNEIRQAVIARRGVNTINGVNPLSLLAMSSLPIGKIINLSTVNRYSFIGDHLIRIYANTIATELALKLVSSVLIDVDKALLNQEIAGSVHSEKLRDLRTDIFALQSTMKDKETEILDRVQSQSMMIAHLEQIERSMYSNLTTSMVQNLGFGR